MGCEVYLLEINILSRRQTSISLTLHLTDVHITKVFVSLCNVHLEELVSFLLLIYAHWYITLYPYLLIILIIAIGVLEFNIMFLE